MSNLLFIDGKEIKFIEVNNEKKKVTLYFTDFTFVAMEDVKIFQKGNDGFWN
jgi:hypothetical protein